MTTFYDKPKNFFRGQQNISADDLNKILKALPRLIVGGKGINVRSFGDRIIVESAARAVGPLDYTAVMEIVDATTYDDYMICSRNEGEVWVAKPAILRGGSQFPSGYSYTYSSAVERESSDGENTENQLITPSYSVGEEIVAIRVHTHLTDESDVPILWMDLNVAGRCWASELV